jgi:ketosteroid isomerase-like protein
LADDRTLIVEQLFSRLNAQEYERLGEVLDEDAVFDVVYSPEGSSFANPVTGAVAVQAVFETGVASMFSSLELKIVETHPAQDPEMIVVEYASSGVAAPTGRPYANRYVGIFKLRHGKIALWREYHNPERMVEAFGSASGAAS